MDDLEDAKRLLERIGINVRSSSMSDGDKKHIQELIDLTVEKINLGMREKDDGANDN